MPAYFQNSADDGTVIVYPDANTGNTIEGFLFDCGYGAAYGQQAVQETTLEALEEEGFDIEVVKAATVVDQETIDQIMELIDETEDDELADWNEAGEAVDALITDFVVFPG